MVCIGPKVWSYIKLHYIFGHMHVSKSFNNLLRNEMHCFAGYRKSKSKKIHEHSKEILKIHVSIGGGVELN